MDLSFCKCLLGFGVRRIWMVFGLYGMENEVVNGCLYAFR